ncbi:MAG: arsenate reductase ArsC [Anaerolineales bacterium]|nr:arsenate reductase ArsC [Anaerolineales bacterium]
MKKNVLFLCTGNSCRSQMAEGLVNAELGEVWQAYSAGTRPSGYVHPLAIRAMSELAIDLSHGRSKHTDDLRHIPFDVVITVCDNAAEDCPIWLGQGTVKHISFPDPADATGTDEEKMTVFRAVRDDIRQRIFDYLRS